MNDFDKGVLAVLVRAWRKPFRVKSDFARYEAGWVAVCASSGFITTMHMDGNFSSTWAITMTGLAKLEELYK